jgi:hypothetical protein
MRFLVLLLAGGCATGYGAAIGYAPSRGFTAGAEALAGLEYDHHRPGLQIVAGVDTDLHHLAAYGRFDARAVDDPRQPGALFRIGAGLAYDRGPTPTGVAGVGYAWVRGRGYTGCSDQGIPPIAKTVVELQLRYLRGWQVVLVARNERLAWDCG